VSEAKLSSGIYDALLDESLRDILGRNPELRTVLGKLDPEEEPARYAAFLAKVVEQALREETDPEQRRHLCNRIISLLAGTPAKDHLLAHQLVATAKPLFP